MNGTFNPIHTLTLSFVDKGVFLKCLSCLTLRICEDGVPHVGLSFKAKNSGGLEKSCILSSRIGSGRVGSAFLQKLRAWEAQREKWDWEMIW